jgi:PAS domain-containing protein
VGSVVVGRDPACEITDADPSLSRRHAEFIGTGSGAIVRDLNSKGGISVNGIKTGRADLTPGDVIQVGALAITYLTETLSGDAADDSEGTGDRTVLNAPGPSGAARQVASELPNVEPRSLAHEGRVARPPRPPARASGANRQPTLGKVTDEPARQARTSRVPWGGRVLVAVLGLALAVLLATVIPMQRYQTWLLDSVAEERAETMATWLAVEAGAALAMETDIQRVTESVADQSEIRTAVVLSLNGRILAPGSRADEVVTTIPGLGYPADIRRPQLAWNGEVLEVVQLVRTHDNPRAAVAWITYRPPPAISGMGPRLIVLSPALLVVLLGGFVAAALLRRMTLRGLTALNEDLELALAGNSTTVSDPLGVKPLQDLATNLNYLVARARAGKPSVSEPANVTSRRSPGERRPSPRVVARPLPSAAKVPRSSRTEGWIVVDRSFRITEASPECAELIGATPSALIGHHLLEAIQDQQIADGILKCLTAVSAGGDTRADIQPAGQSFRLAVAVTGEASKETLTVSLTREPTDQP